MLNKIKQYFKKRQLSKVEKAITTIGVNVRTDEEDYRNIGDIFDELALTWQNTNKKERKALIKLFN